MRLVRLINMYIWKNDKLATINFMQVVYKLYKNVAQFRHMHCKILTESYKEEPVESYVIFLLYIHVHLSSNGIPLRFWAEI